MVVRHPARRARHRHADQDRAGRPAAGDVRPAWRVPGRRHRRPVARRLLRRRHRGGADRTHLPDTGDPADRRLPGQRRRAVAAARRGGDAVDRPRLRHRAATGRDGTIFLPYLRDEPWPVRGRCRARPGWSTASAASRRPTAPATSPTTPPTTTRWCACGRPRSTASPATSPMSSSTTRCRARASARACWCSAGDRPTARSPRPSAGSARPAGGSPRRICATSIRSPPTSARCCAATTA